MKVSHLILFFYVSLSLFLVACDSGTETGNASGSTTHSTTPSDAMTEDEAIELVLGTAEVQAAADADPNFGAMVSATPTEDHPYFEIKTGSNMDSHFATTQIYLVDANTGEVLRYNVVDDVVEAVE